MKVSIKENTLIISIPLGEQKVSSTGKSIIVATSGGNKETEAEINGKKVFVGLNAYIKK